MKYFTNIMDQSEQLPLIIQPRWEFLEERARMKPGLLAWSGFTCQPRVRSKNDGRKTWVEQGRSDDLLRTGMRGRVGGLSPVNRWSSCSRAAVRVCMPGNWRNDRASTVWMSNGIVSCWIGQYGRCFPHAKHASHPETCFATTHEHLIQTKKKTWG